MFQSDRDDLFLPDFFFTGVFLAGPSLNFSDDTFGVGRLVHGASLLS